MVRHLPARDFGVSLQTLVRLVKEQDGGVFDPEDIAVMATAFDWLLADFNLTDRNDDPLVTMLARLVIEIVRTGERDPERIRQERARSALVIRPEPRTLLLKCYCATARNPTWRR
jgi:hypothetical protein